MKSIRSFADVVRDWEQLLEAVNDNSAGIGEAAAPHKAALESSLAALRDKKAIQESCTASRQQATQDLEALMEQGNENARRLRGVVKSVLGTRSERLVQFGVAPLRTRRRSQTAKPKPGDSALKSSAS